MSRYWKCQPWFPGETFFLVGGGPSLKQVDLTLLAGRRTIAINNAYAVVPNADVVFFADLRWFNWHADKLAREGSGRIISTASARLFSDPRVCRMGRNFEAPLSHDPTLLSGNDSGAMALNLAYHLGASRIVLLGFDMGFAADGSTHFHEGHEVPSQEDDYINLFAPLYPGMVKELQRMGVEVIRCTPSRLDFIPEVPLAEALALPRRQRG